MLALLVLLLVQPARSDTPTLQPHPALAQHSSALARIAASSDEPLAERQRLWSSLRGHAQRRGSQAAAELGGAVAGLGLKAAQGLPTHVSRQRTVTPPGLDAGDIDPVSFGADPTGIRDSTEAMARAVQELLHGGVRRRSTLSSNITDLAGACLNLGGGEYLLSAPIIIPQFFGNFEISGGTLRASKTFPSSAHLITIGAAPCNPDYAASCNEFIGLSNLLLDASHTAAGAIRIISAMGVTVGPAVFVERFTQTGIRIDGGHETLIHESWFVETYWSNLPPAPPPPPGPGTPVMARCDGSQAQRWELIAGGAKKQLDAALPGSLVSAASGQCFDVDGCDTPTVGTGVLMWSCNSAYPGNNCNSTNQLWTFEPRTGQLTTTMNSGHGHLCLEAAPRLQLAQCDTSNPDQAWTLHSNATLTNAGQGADQCLSIPTPSPSPTPPAPGPAAPALNNHSIAVQINGNDHYIVDSIIWQYTNLGVEINGAANLLQGVHAWGSGCGRFTYLTGIKVNAYQNRLLGCYLDLNHLDLMGGGSQSIVVESSFFLGTNTRIYGAGAGGSGIVSNTYMQANLGDSVQLVGNFTEATRCLIGGAGDSGPSTRATKRLTLVGQTSFKFDFSAELLFPWIDSVSYSVIYDGSLKGDPAPAHFARTPVGRAVVVEFAHAFADGSASNVTVHMEVAQCL